MHALSGLYLGVQMYSAQQGHWLPLQREQLRKVPCLIVLAYVDHDSAFEGSHCRRPLAAVELDKYRAIAFCIAAGCFLCDGLGSSLSRFTC